MNVLGASGHKKNDRAFQAAPFIPPARTAKKVACFYRVSTKMQLEEDDIPMQRKACLSFISKNPSWEFDREYIEKGVSGYHNSESRRGVLLQMKNDAKSKEFDVLLVFMFDRLGRREDETSFIAEWLVANGVEVWSVEEGQQRFDNRTDKLINYIRYWQSGGESEKISIRVAEKHRQLVREGKFRGGPPPYGYDLVCSEEFNRKGHERKKLVINYKESPVVKKIFSFCGKEDFGSRKMAGYLNKNNIPTKNGNVWTAQAVIRTIRNPIYKGDYVSGKVRNLRDGKQRTAPENWTHSRDTVEELVIVDEKAWALANENLEKRNTRTNPGSKHANDLLLLGLAYCGHCGTKSAHRTRAAKRTLKRSGETVTYTSDYYSCPQKTKQGKCGGQFGYGAKRTEAVVIEEVHNCLRSVRADNNEDKTKDIISDKINDIRAANNKKNTIKDIIKNKKKAIIDNHRKECTRLIRIIQKSETELADLNNEIIKCLTAEEELHKEKLALITAQKAKESDLYIKELERHKLSLLEKLNEFKSIEDAYPAAFDPEKEYETADFKSKKELLRKLIDSIHIYRGKIDIRFTLDIYGLNTAEEVEYYRGSY